MKRLFYLILLMLLLPLYASAADSTYYFSYSTGSDTSPGDGSQDHPWKTLEKAQEIENTKTSTDTLTLRFKRGDTWPLVHDGSPDYLLHLNNCRVTVTDYDTGALPVFDCGEEVFSKTVKPIYDYTARARWEPVIAIAFDGCMVSNLEIKNHHGNAIYIIDKADGYVADNNTISGCTLHNLGQAGIHSVVVTTGGGDGTSGNTIEYNTVYDTMRNMETEYTSNYGGGINMAGVGGLSGWAGPHDNLIQYNHVYNNFGEGIWNPGGITQYNIIGDTWSAGVHIPPQMFNASISIVRYNLIYGRTGTIYSQPSTLWSTLSSPSNNGIKMTDEVNTSGVCYGDDSDGEVWIYGNIIINRKYGIWLLILMDVPLSTHTPRFGSSTTQS